MNQLITQEQIANLPTVQRDFVQLRVGNKAIRDLDTPVIKRACAEIISKAFFDAGQSMGQNTEEANKVLAYQTEALFSELKGVFTNLTLPELKESFRRGIRNDSGQYFGLCGKTYHQFIKWFYNLPERQKSWVDFLALTETPPEPKIDKALFSKEACKKAFDHYKQTKEMPFAAFAYYDILNELVGTDYNGVKTLVTDKEVRKEITVRLTDQHTKQMLFEKKKQEYKGNLSQAEGIMSAITADFKTGKSLENLIKAEFLKVYFDKIDSLPI